jgi:hypothetical protein
MKRIHPTATGLVLIGLALTSGGLADGALAVGLAAPASADYDTAGYIDAVNKAGLISPSKFTDASDALWTGVWVCKQVEQGRSRDSIVYDLSHGEGMLLSSYNAATLYDAATTYLC